MLLIHILEVDFLTQQAEQLKTGTTTIALLCKDGVVMGADRRVTSGYHIAHKKFLKIVKITDYMAITTAGLVSDAQLLAKLLKAEIRLKEIQTKRKVTVKEVANLLAGMSYSNFRKFSAVQGIVGFLLGGRDATGSYVYDIGIDGSLSKIENFVSDGSGSVYAIGALESLYKPDMTVEEGVKVVRKGLNSALQRDVATGNGIDIITITDKGFKTILEETINTGVQ